MITASVREVQHHFSRVLEHVEDGESVLVTRRGRVVAVLSPPTVKAPPDWPDMVREMQAVYGRPAVVSREDAEHRDTWERGER
jgi:prevent-host-death family protein